MTDQEVIRNYQLKITELQGLIEKYKAIISLLQGNVYASNKDNSDLSINEGDMPLWYEVTDTSKLSFKGKVLNILKSENRPMLSKEIHSLYVKETGKDVSMSTFSGQFSTAFKQSNEIKRYINKEGNIENRNYYGLSAWFSGEYLNPTYLEKIKAAM